MKIQERFKPFPKILIPAFLLILVSSCKKENSFDCLKSTGKDVVEKRIVKDFSSLDISDNINVFITQASEQSISVEAGENIIENIITEVENNTLYIKNNNKCNWVRDFDREVNVYIQSSKINNISYRGFGEVKTVGNYNTGHFFVDMWMASGSMDLLLNCDTVFLKSHTGTADIRCKGTATTVIVYMNGTGVIDARDLQSNYVLAINRDVGDIYVNPKKILDAEIFSRGDIFYSQGVEEINVVDKGEGELISF